MAKGKSFLKTLFFWGNGILWIGFIGILAIAFTPLTGYLLKPLAIKEEIRPADAIVVLGGGVNRGRYLTLSSSHRLLRGVQLYHEGKAERIVFSGGASGEGDAAEGAVMAQEARRMQVAADKIIVEKNSRRTREQAEEIKKILGLGRRNSVVLVTSFSHMKRAVLCFEQFGLKVYPAPADPLEKYAAGPLERIDLFGKIIREYAGLMYYRARGWI